VTKHKKVVTTTFRRYSASLSLRYDDDGTAKLSNLYSELRGQGHASALMEVVMKHADDEGISLWLEVQRFGATRDGLDNETLIAFYERFGFDLVEDDRRPRWMTREPLERRAT
jgi:GNAT superfamily N-acetyltransferase